MVSEISRNIPGLTRQFETRRTTEVSSLPGGREASPELEKLAIRYAAIAQASVPLISKEWDGLSNEQKAFVREQRELGVKFLTQGTEEFGSSLAKKALEFLGLGEDSKFNEALDRLFFEVQIKKVDPQALRSGNGRNPQDLAKSVLGESNLRKTLSAIPEIGKFVESLFKKLDSISGKRLAELYVVPAEKESSDTSENLGNALVNLGLLDGLKEEEDPNGVSSTAQGATENIESSSVNNFLKDLKRNKDSSAVLDILNQGLEDFATTPDKTAKDSPSKAFPELIKLLADKGKKILAQGSIGERATKALENLSSALVTRAIIDTENLTEQITNPASANSSKKEKVEIKEEAVKPKPTNSAETNKQSLKDLFYKAESSTITYEEFQNAINTLKEQKEGKLEPKPTRESSAESAIDPNSPLGKIKAGKAVILEDLKDLISSRQVSLRELSALASEGKLKIVSNQNSQLILNLDSLYELVGGMIMDKTVGDTPNKEPVPEKKEFSSPKEQIEKLSDDQKVNLLLDLLTPEQLEKLTNSK